MKKLYEKYKDVISYLFFGACTTLVNIIVYWVCAHIFIIGVMSSTIVAWMLAVFFAYFTNRRWVFHSRKKGFKVVLKEIARFWGCRLTTGLLDWVMMYILVDYLNYNDVFIKIFANIVVIILNYIASKWVVFGRVEK